MILKTAYIDTIARGKGASSLTNWHITWIFIQSRAATAKVDVNTNISTSNIHSENCKAH